MRRFDRISPLLAALVSAIVWWVFDTARRLPDLEIAAPPGTFDFLAYYRPNAQYAFARLAAGEIPLWNPQQGLGLPFLATLQTGVLYPPNWLHLLLPTQLAFALLAAAHLGLAAGLAAALARALGATGSGALAAGLLFGGSHWLFGALWSPPTLYSAAWLPGVLLAIDRIVERPSPGRVAALAGAIAMQALTGWPYVLLMTCLAAALFAGGALIEVALRERRLPVARALALAVGALGGALLAAPQLLPAAELVARSSRAPGVLASDQTVLLTGQHDPAYFLAALFGSGVNDGVPGVIALPFAALALVWPGPRRVRLALLLGVGLFGLLVSFPLHVPLYGWLREIPLAGDFRFPFRYRLLSTLALSVAAGVGVSQTASRLARSARARELLAAGLALAAAGLETAVILPATVPFPREANGHRPPGIAPLLQGLVARGAAEGRLHWQHADELPWIDKIGQMEGLRFTHDLEPLTPAPTARFLNYLETGSAETLDARDLKRRLAAASGSQPQEQSIYLGTIPFFGRVGLPADPSRLRLFDLASIRFVLSHEPPAWLGDRYPRVRELGMKPAVFENAAALPRAYRAVLAEAEPSKPERALARLTQPGFDARNAVLLDAPPSELLQAGGGAAEADAGVTFLDHDDPERQVIRTRGTRPAVVVMTDAFYPGWDASVDGAPAAVLRVNTVFRGVVVPAGEHVVEMRYRPRPFRLGVALALGTLLTGAAYAAASAWHRRRAA